MFSRFKSQKSWSNPLKPSCSHDFSIRCSSHFFGNCQDLPGEAPHRRGLARPHLRPDLERRRGRAQGPGPGAVGCCWTSWPQGFRRPWSSWIHWWRALAEFVVDGTRWCPPNVINLFINPIHYRYTTNKNHSYWSYKPTYDMLGI